MKGKLEQVGRGMRDLGVPLIMIPGVESSGQCVHSLKYFGIRRWSSDDKASEFTDAANLEQFAFLVMCYWTCFRCKAAFGLVRCAMCLGQKDRL